MKCLILAAAALLSLASALPAQTSGATAPQTAPTPTQASPAPKRQPPKPAAEAAPGGGPDQVWVNTTTSVYHCPGTRYYGKTAHGRYMTEAAAKAAGAKGTAGKTCFAK